MPIVDYRVVVREQYPLDPWRWFNRLKNRQDGMRTGKTNDIVFIISGVNRMMVKVG